MTIDAIVRNIPTRLQDAKWGHISHINNLTKLFNDNLLTMSTFLPEHQRKLKDERIERIHYKLIALQRDIENYRPSLCQRIINFIFGRFFTIFRLRRVLPDIIALTTRIHNKILQSKKKIPPPPYVAPIVVPRTGVNTPIAVVREIVKIDEAQTTKAIDQLKKEMEANNAKIIADVRAEVAKRPIINALRTPSATPPSRNSPPSTLTGPVNSVLTRENLGTDSGNNSPLSDEHDAYSTGTPVIITPVKKPQVPSA